LRAAFRKSKREGDEVRVAENLCGWALVLSVPCRIVEDTKTRGP